MTRRRGGVRAGGGVGIGVGLGVGLACAGLVLLLVAAVALTGRPDATGGAVALPPASGRLPAATASPPTASPPTASAPTVSPAPAGPPARGARLLLPRLHIDAAVDDVDLDGKVMRVPRDPHRVGWWTGGAAPGAVRGSAVFVGHVNYGGVRGAFAALPGLRPGDRIALTDPDVTFRVTAVRSFAKSSGLPQSLFTRDGPAQLVLITCGGSFDAADGNYRDNVVVYAVRV